VAPRFVTNTFVQAILLVVIAFVLGIVFNAARPIPVQFDETPAFETLPHIAIQRGYKAWETGGSLFLDARPTVFYQQGHILNSLSMPLKSPEADIRNLLPQPHPFDKVIVYCEDEQCDAADAMARRLKRLGYDKIFVLEGGWRSWSQANLPIN